jgi:hypothetical protein
MNSNKRQRTDEDEIRPAPLASATARAPKLRLSDELATKLGTRYCTDSELVTLVLCAVAEDVLSCLENPYSDADAVAKAMLSCLDFRGEGHFDG